MNWLEGAAMYSVSQKDFQFVSFLHQCNFTISNHLYFPDMNTPFSRHIVKHVWHGLQLYSLRLIWLSISTIQMENKLVGLHFVKIDQINWKLIKWIKTIKMLY